MSNRNDGNDGNDGGITGAQLLEIVDSSESPEELSSSDAADADATAANDDGDGDGGDNDGDRDDNGNVEEKDEEDDSHMDECFICEDGGELICCDGEGCRKAYHADCVGEDIDTLPLTWFCPSCVEEKESNDANSKATESTSKLSDEGDAENDKGNAGADTFKKGAAEDGGASATHQTASSKRKEVVPIIDVEGEVEIENDQGNADFDASKKGTTIEEGSLANSEKDPAESKKGGAEESGLVNEKMTASETLGAEEKTNTATTAALAPMAEDVTIANDANKQSKTQQSSALGSATSTTLAPTTDPPTEAAQVQTAQTAKPPPETIDISSASSSPSPEQTALHQKSGQESSSSSEAPPRMPLPCTTTTFRTVIVPEGVMPGDTFHVRLDNNQVMGVICPKDVHPGDQLLILEPGNYTPPLDPRAIAHWNARQLLHGMNEPSKKYSTASAEEEHKSTSLVEQAFWKILWPHLHLHGWVYSRTTEYNFGYIRFYPLHSHKLMAKKLQRLNVHYFDTIKGIVDWIVTMPKYGKVMEEFYAHIDQGRKKEMMATVLDAEDTDIMDEDAEASLGSNISKSTTGTTASISEPAKKKRKKRVSVLEQIPRLEYERDAWKYAGSDERQPLRVGSQYQVRRLPRVGTYEVGEGKEHIQDQIWNVPSSVPTLTQSKWHDWANETNFADQFHTKIIQSKKEMPLLASKIDKPMEFCLWYYYHKYKPSRRYGILKKFMREKKEVEKNSDECALCDDGGDLLCCETCTDSYHLECLGLTSSDVDGVEQWSCPTCVQRRKLHLSPQKSPQRQKLARGEDDDDHTDDKDYSPESQSSIMQGSSSVSNLNKDLPQRMDDIKTSSKMDEVT